MTTPPDATARRHSGRDDCTIDQDWERYSPDEHQVWTTLYERQTALLPGRA
eukprot:gene21027-28851_t